MQPRSSLLILASLALACTATTNDDSGGTEVATSTATGTTSGPAGTSTTATTGPGATSGDPTTSGTPGSTGAEDPTSTGGSAEVTGADSGSGATDEGTAEATGPGGVSFTEVFEQVILPNGCNSGYCHGGGAGGLEMTDEATSYANLVDMAATTMVCGQSMRVVPGSLDESIVWYRVRPAALDNGNACAPKMPPGSMGLSEAEAQLVNDWIAGGALE